MVMAALVLSIRTSGSFVYSTIKVCERTHIEIMEFYAIVVSRKSLNQRCVESVYVDVFMKFAWNCPMKNDQTTVLYLPMEV